MIISRSPQVSSSDLLNLEARSAGSSDHAENMLLASSGSDELSY